MAQTIHDPGPPGGGARGSVALCAIGCGVVLALLATTTRTIPLLLDDLTAIDIFWPAGRFEPARLLDVAWPVDVRFSFHAHFRPVGWASLFLDLAVFGPAPGALRLVAWSIHAACAVLTGAAAWRLARSASPTCAVLAGSVFLLHPLCAEPVLWVAHRFTLLSTLFFLLGLHATITHARSGRLLWLVCLAALLALGSKDSLLTAVWALVPLVPLLAPPGARRARTLRVALAVGGAFAICLILRRLATGRWVPTFTGDGDVLASFDTLGRLAEGPGMLGALFAPGLGDGSPMSVLAAGCLGMSVLALAGLLLRRPPGSAAGALLLVALLGAGLPAWGIGPELAGSRQLHLPLVAAAMLLAGGLERLWPLALLLPALLAAGLQQRCAAYLDAADQIAITQAAIEQRADTQIPLLVGGLPATWRGAPLFGPRIEHLPIRFRPPLREFALAVEGVAAQDWASCLDGRPRPLRLLGLERGRRGGPDRLAVGFAAEVRAASGKGDTELELVNPVRGARWDGRRLEFTAAIPVPDEGVPFLVELHAAEVVASLIVVGRGAPVPGVALTRFLISPSRDAVWTSSGTARVLERAARGSLPATLVVRGAALPGTSGHGLGSASRAVLLVRAP